MAINRRTNSPLSPDEKSDQRINDFLKSQDGKVLLRNEGLKVAKPWNPSYVSLLNPLTLLRRVIRTPMPWLGSRWKDGRRRYAEEFKEIRDKRKIAGDRTNIIQLLDAGTGKHLANLFTAEYDEGLKVQVHHVGLDTYHQKVTAFAEKLKESLNLEITHHGLTSND